MAALTHDSLIAAFESRFDHLSARAVASQVLDNAGIKKSDSYDAAAIARITSSVETIVTRPAPILSRLTPNGAAAPAPVAAKAPEKAAEKPAEKAPAEAPKDEAKADAPAKAEAKAAAEAPAKAEAADAAHADEAGDKHGEKKKKEK